MFMYTQMCFTQVTIFHAMNRLDPVAKKRRTARRSKRKERNGKKGNGIS